jgi:hypothetical protein
MFYRRKVNFNGIYEYLLIKKIKRNVMSIFLKKRFFSMEPLNNRILKFNKLKKYIINKID